MKTGENAGAGSYPGDTNKAWADVANLGKDPKDNAEVGVEDKTEANAQVGQEPETLIPWREWDLQDLLATNIGKEVEANVDFVLHEGERLADYDERTYKEFVDLMVKKGLYNDAVRWDAYGEMFATLRGKMKEAQREGFAEVGDELPEDIPDLAKKPEETEAIEEEPVQEQAEPEEEQLIEKEPSDSREKLDEWLKEMQAKGSALDYWKSLGREYWVNGGAPMDDASAVRALLESAKQFLHKRFPKMDEAGIDERANMAVKLQLEDLAREEQELKTKAKMKRNGERVLPKGWQDWQVHKFYYEMMHDLERVYHGDEQAQAEVTDGAMDENEQIAWRVAAAPRKPGTLNMTILRDNYPRREGEGADDYFARLQAYTKQDKVRENQLKLDKRYEAEQAKKRAAEKEAARQDEVQPEEVETKEAEAERFVVVPTAEGMVKIPLSEKKDVEAEGGESANVETETTETKTEKAEGKVARVWRKLRDKLSFRKRRADVVEALAEADDEANADVAEVADEAPVVAEDEQGSEEAGESKESLTGKDVAEWQRKVNEFRERAELLPDDDPGKAYLLQCLDQMNANLVEAQGYMETMLPRIDATEERIKKGILNDRVNEMEAEALAAESLAFDTLCKEGFINREKTWAENLQILEDLTKVTEYNLHNAARTLAEAFAESQEAGEQVLQAKARQVFDRDLLEKIPKARAYAEKMMAQEAEVAEEERIA